VGTRGIHIDGENSVLDSILQGSLKHVVDNAHIETGFRDASLCYAQGKELGRTPFHKLVTDKIRFESEKCDQLWGFFPFHSAGGGTGSGYYSVLYDFLMDSFPRAENVEFELNPSVLYSAPTEPINACLLAAHKIGRDESHGLNMLFDNQSLYRLMFDNLGIENPTFANVNELIACVFSNLSFYCEQNLPSVKNICPFKHINHLTCAVLPLKHRLKTRAPQDIWNLLVDSFAVNHEMCSVDMTSGKYLCANLFIRGKGNHPEIYGALNQINKFAEFVSYVPTGFNLHTTDVAYIPLEEGVIDTVPIMMTKISNHSSIGVIFEKLQEQMNLVLSKKAFVHHYFDHGMNLEDFKEANEHLSTMLQTYDEILMDDAREEVVGDVEN